jgi:hypothetical protein
MESKMTDAQLSDSDSRRITVMRGVKEGALKSVVDKLVHTMSDPVCQAIMPKFKETFPQGGHMLEPAVKVALEFAFIMGIAELMLFAAPTASRIIPTTSPEEMTKKSQLLATWMRKYAGERVGEQLVEAALAVFPMVMTQFSEISSTDVAEILGESTVELAGSERK